MDSIGIGLAGYGGIGKVHALGYRSIPHFYPGRLPRIRLTAVATSNAESAARAVREAEFERGYGDFRQLIADRDVAVVDCSLPNFLHMEVILSALAAGKHVYCEKPLCMNGAQAREIAHAAQSARSHVGMTFNYRFVPAVMRAKALIESDALGEIYNFRFEYLHTGYQDASRPLTWRVRKEDSGGGAIVDLGSHAIDLVRHLLGEIDAVFATSKTFIAERPLRAGSDERGAVSVDDAMWLQTRLSSGAVGSIEVSRFATGALDDLRFRIEGRKGALKFDLMDPNWLYWFDATRTSDTSGSALGWTRLETVQGYPGAAIPPARTVIGWTRTHAENQYRFLMAIVEGKEPSPGLADGVAAQLVVAAAQASAANERWTIVDRL